MIVSLKNATGKMELSDVVQSIYDASIDDNWIGALRFISRAFGDAAVGLGLQHMDPFGGASVLQIVRADLDCIRRLETDYNSIQTNSLNLAFGKANPGDPFYFEQFIDRKDIERTDVYHDVFASQGLTQWLGATVERREDFVAPFTLMRERTEKSFSTDEVALLSAITPHLRNALRTYIKLQNNKLSLIALEKSLYAHPYGIILLDSKGHIVFANPIAESRIGKELTTDDGRLTAGDRSLRRKFDILLARVIDTNDHSPRTSESMVLSFARDNTTVRCQTIPLGESLSTRLYKSPAALLVIDVGSASLKKEQVFSSLEPYKLSLRELESLYLLSRGHNSKEIALRMNVSENSVKTYISRARLKTGADSQKELLRILEFKTISTI